MSFVMSFAPIFFISMGMSTNFIGRAVVAFTDV